MGVGDLVAERFELEGVAGSGAMGTVYRARDRHTGGLVAVKLLHGQGSTSAAERFAREARLLSELRHPGIVRYIAHGSAGDAGAYIAMEWLEGEDLAARLAREGLEIAEAIELGARLADALGAAHARGIVHRDIKPQNVFLPDGRVERAKLLDFGIARARETVRARTRTGAMLGTPGYMAPEQARASGEVGPAADVFALGAVLFECLTGEPAFSGAHMMAMLAKVLFERPPRAGEVRPGIPADVDALVGRMLARDPAARPANGSAAAEELRALGHVRGAAPRARAGAHALTGSEQRLVSVVLIGTPWSDEAAGGGDLGEDSATVVQPFAELSAAIRDAVESRGGRVEALADGSVVAALYGSAVGSGAVVDQVARAARIALALRDLVPDLPIALATGRAHTSDGAPLGDVVDRAASILGAAPRAAGTRLPVWIDTLSADLLGTRFDTDELEGGLALGAERAEAASAARSLLGKPMPLVGRDRELLMIEATVTHSLGEHVARAVLVTAGAGEGKSRLAEELCARVLCAHHELRIWRARGDTIRSNARFGILGQLVRAALALDGSAPVERRREGILAALDGRELGAETDRVCMFLGELAGAPFSDEASLQLRAARADAVLMRDQMRRAWDDWLAAELHAAPVLLVLDDLHWADAPSLEALDDSLRRHEEQPWVVLGLGRDELAARFPELWAARAVTEVRLAPLSARSSAKLVRHALGPGAQDDVVERIVSRAAGNALFLEELVRSVALGRGDALPETVLAMAQARLERLDPEARRVLRAASVYGLELRSAGVAALLGGPERAAGTEEWIDVLVAEELLLPVRGRAHADTHAFRSAVVREAAYAMLGDADRALGHRIAAEWLEGEGERDAVVLAEHFAAGGEPARAVSCYVRAVGQALEANDLDAVLALTARAESAGASGQERGALMLACAEAHNWRGRPAEALTCGNEAMSLLPARSRAWIVAAGETIVASTTVSDVDRAVAIVRELLRIAPTAETTGSLITALARAAAKILASARYAVAEDIRKKLDSVEASARASASGVALDARAWLGHARAGYGQHAGDPAEFLRHLEESAALFETMGNLRFASIQRVNFGFACVETGLYERGEAAERSALAIGEELRLGRVSAAARQNLGYAIARRAVFERTAGAIDADEARRRFEAALVIEHEAIDTFSAHGDDRLAGGGEIYVALILRELGRLEEAERAARAGIALLEVAPALSARAHAELSSVLLARGDAEGALAAAVRATTIRTSLGFVETGESEVRLAYVEALAAAGANAEARVALAAARDRLVERAGCFSDPALRKSFLEHIPENARTLALATEMGV